MKNVINLLVISMLLLISCETESTIPDEQLSEKELDSGTVFKTIFFYLGDEAKAIPSYEEQVALLEKNNTENNEFLERYEASAEAYLRKVNEKNPKFLDELKNAVVSKDFEQIRASLVYGGNLMTAIATMDALKATNNKDAINEFAKINSKNYDVTNPKELELLVSDLGTVMKADPTPHPDKPLTYNYNFAAIITFHWTQTYFMNYNFNFVNSTNFNLNLNFAEIMNYFGQNSLGTISKYENYAGEKLIEDIAFAF